MKKYYGVSEVYSLLKKSFQDNSFKDLCYDNYSWETFDIIIENYFLNKDADAHYIKGSSKDALITFNSDCNVYGVNSVLKGLKSNLYILSGEDGSLNYIYFCSTCGTIIIDDHGDDYQLDNSCSLKCPVCNPINTEHKHLYHYFYITKKDNYGRWLEHMYTYAQMNKGKFLSFFDRLHFYKYKKIKNIFTIIKFECKYHKNIREPFISNDYVVATDCSKIKLRWR